MIVLHPTIANIANTISHYGLVTALAYLQVSQTSLYRLTNKQIQDCLKSNIGPDLTYLTSLCQPLAPHKTLTPPTAVGANKLTLHHHTRPGARLLVYHPIPYHHVLLSLPSSS